MNKIEKAILKTLVYFDILNRPLSLDELLYYLYHQQASKLQVFVGLKNLLSKKMIEQEISPKSGQIYYFIGGKKAIVPEYFAKFLISAKRWQKVYRVLKIIRLAPFVKMIAVINSLSYNNSRQDSDIDILIVAKRGRLWTARAFMILLLEIIGQNKNQWYQAGKFCLGFAFDGSRLNLSRIKYRDDIDFTYWLANLTPVYDKGIYRDLIEQNQWLKRELPNWEEKKCEVQSSKKLKTIEKILSGEFGDRLENWLAKIQIKRIWQDPKNKRQGASVIADPRVMKLHPFDKRAERQKAWEKHLTSLIAPR